MSRSGILVAALVLAAGPVFAQASFDGVYRAPPGGIVGNSACGTTRFGYALRVSGGVASMMTVFSGELQGPVGPDGSVNIEKGVAHLNGKITGRHFAATYSRGSCAFSLQYDK